MDLKVYEATTEELAALAKKLPVGRLYSDGRGFVPNVRQNLYSQIIVELAASLRPPSAKTLTSCRWRLACPGPGTRSRLATSSLLRKLWNMAGGKPSSSSATATCSRCGFGTSRNCPSSHAIVCRRLCGLQCLRRRRLGPALEPTGLWQHRRLLRRPIDPGADCLKWARQLFLLVAMHKTQ